MMSRSLTESAWRRSEPATSTCSELGCERSAPTICSAMFSARDSRIRGAGPPSGDSASVLSSCSSAFAPNPRSSRIFCSSAAARSASSESIAELVVEPPRALRPEARQVHDREQPARELVAQLLGGRDVAGLVEREDLLLEDLADPVELGDAAVARHLHHRDRRLAHGLGRRAVGDHAVGDGAVEFVEVAELVERGGDLGVGQVGHGPSVRALIWLILPTYAEAAGLPGVIAGAREALAHEDLHILVVDDASPRRHRRARREARRRGAAPPAQARPRLRLRGRLHARARA